ncbi:amino acid ABC transporter permease [Komagataeibacter xylinus]|uniref:amino acid ABC transporter permease n=1 Tax=Komagataeibacter xylinus TaxID=28448 RepID=UPI00280B87FC|nr:amino acid ABC transporter permease [Komagataeibacter xylinus]
MSYQWDFGLVWHYAPLLGTGIEYTLGLTVVTSVIGMVIGTCLALCQQSRMWFISVPLGMVSEVFRCTPSLVQLIWCYYALPIVLGITLSPMSAALLALSIYGGVFYGEIFRAGLRSIDPGQWDGARALGMTSWTMMRRVILPQVLRRMVGPMVSQTVLQLKNTSLVSVVTVPDLVYQGQMVASATYRPLEVYTTIAILYFLILFPLTQLSRLLERRWA